MFSAWLTNLESAFAMALRAAPSLTRRVVIGMGTAWEGRPTLQ